MLASHRTIRWIESLAEQESSIHLGERSNIDILKTKEDVLSVETAAFVRELFYHFEFLIRLFNVRVEKDSLKLQLQRTSELFDGFFMTRNGLRLTVLANQPGAIQLNCEKVDRQPGGAMRSSFLFSGMIEAQFGAFHDVAWVFLGSPVTTEQVARHYLTEFIQSAVPC